MKRVTETKTATTHRALYYRSLLSAILISGGVWLFDRLRFWSHVPVNGYVLWLLVAALGGFVGFRFLPDIIERRRRFGTGLTAAAVCLVTELHMVPFVPASLQRTRPLPQLVFAGLLCALVTHLYAAYRHRAHKVTDGILLALLFVFVIAPLLLILWFVHAYNG